MINHIKNNVFIIYYYARKLFYFTIIMNIVGIISITFIYDDYLEYLNYQIINNIKEHKTINTKELCKLVKCYSFEDEITHNRFILTDDYLVPSEKTSELYQIYDKLYLKNWHAVLYSHEAHTFFTLDNAPIIDTYIHIMNIFIPLSLLFFMLPLIRGMKKEKNKYLLELASNEAILSNKSMINIAENIHHELNTPIEVIDNKINKISSTVGSIISMCKNEKVKHLLMSLEKEFDYISNSSEQIYSVLTKMKNYKNLRYSNGNKTIKDIMEGSFSIVGISNSDFMYKVDNRFSDYYLDDMYMKNAGLLGIILNHIKNSLEANSTNVYILFRNKNNNNLIFRIIDNGYGIEPNKQDKIFDPNFSTKYYEDTIRGNGMYLNKYILNNSGGYVKLIHSGNKGTTIEISIKVKEK